MGLQGWWAGKSGMDDFSGHLLHVRPEFGRWTGRVYTARDIAQMNGWRDNKQYSTPLERVSASGRADVRAREGLLGSGLGGSTVGTPLMEVFVRPAEPGSAPPATDGGSSAMAGQSLVHQAVALRPPPSREEQRRARQQQQQQQQAAVPSAAGPSGSAGNTPAPAPAPSSQLSATTIVRFNIVLGRDGGARIRVLPPQQMQSKFSSAEEEEMRATLAALAVRRGQGGGAFGAYPSDCARHTHISST